MVCNRTQREAGGRRLVAQPLRGTRVSSKPDGGAERNHICCIRLSARKERYLAVWGEQSLFTGDVIDRARAECENGRRPWFCQVCGQRACRHCGAPERRPAISDYVCPDGRILHCPSLGADTGCLNRKCRRYKHY